MPRKWGIEKEENIAEEDQAGNAGTENTEVKVGDGKIRTSPMVKKTFIKQVGSSR